MASLPVSGKRVTVVDDNSTKAIVIMIKNLPIIFLLLGFA